MSALAPIGPKLAKLIPLLSSDKDGEVVATARAIERTLRAEGCDWHDLASAVTREPETRIIYINPPEPEPRDWCELARWSRDHDDDRLNTKERSFVNDMANRLVCGGDPTEKQAAWLRSIYAKLRSKP
jgi:hypothetical protein